MESAGPRPLVGVCPWLETARWGANFEGRAALVEASFLERLGAAGADVAIMPAQPRLAELVRSLDGVLLVGGPDIVAGPGAPEAEAAARPDVAARDRAELAVAARALRDGIPLLGVCRGCEVLNVAAGGTLVAEVADRYEGVEHNRYGGGPERPFEFAHHAVEADPANPVGAAMGSRFEVSSSHHQAVDDLAPGFHVAARSADGLVEAIYAPDHPFAVGVQWHPEADESEGLFVALVAAAAHRRDPARS